MTDKRFALTTEQMHGARLHRASATSSSYRMCSFSRTDDSRARLPLLRSSEEKERPGIASLDLYVVR